MQMVVLAWKTTLKQRGNRENRARISIKIKTIEFRSMWACVGIAQFRAETRYQFGQYRCMGIPYVYPRAHVWVYIRV